MDKQRVDAIITDRLNSRRGEHETDDRTMTEVRADTIETARTRAQAMAPRNGSPDDPLGVEPVTEPGVDV